MFFSEILSSVLLFWSDLLYKGNCFIFKILGSGKSNFVVNNYFGRIYFNVIKIWLWTKSLKQSLCEWRENHKYSQKDTESKYEYCSKVHIFCVFQCISLHLYNVICKMEVSYENRIYCKHFTIYFKKLKSILMQTRIVDFIKYDKF